MRKKGGESDAMSIGITKRSVRYWVVSIAMALCFAPGIVCSQEGESKEGQQETRKVGGISAKTYEKFAKAQEFTEVDDFAGALKVLDQIKNQKKLRPAEAIQLYNFYGVVYFSMEDYKKSITAFETMLQQEELEPRQRTETLYTLAQLHFTIEDWEGAIKIMDEWLANVPKPPPDPLILLSSAYYQLERYDEMIAPIERAMNIARERDKEIKESWWLLLRVAYYEQNNIPKVTEILEVLVVNWPKKEYWTMLSGMYGEQNKELRQLAAYESAYDQDLLIRNSELVTLSQLLMQAEAGFKAARILEKGFEAGIVEESLQNYRLLSQAWSMAAEYEKALPPLTAAAAESKDGELDSRLANSYLNLGRYEECVAAADGALKKGKLKRVAVTHELRGMCQFELKKFDASIKSFRQAAKDEDVEKRARNWISFIESEKNRIYQLNDSIKQARAARDAMRERAAN
jgi:tetratricopeptide (TPR) repeat protein